MVAINKKYLTVPFIMLLGYIIMIPVGKVEASSISEVHGDEVLLPANISDVEGAIVTTNIEDVSDLLSQDDIDEVLLLTRN